MIILPHLLIGAAIGWRVHNIGLIFILALAAHFIADRLPHWDYINQEVNELGEKNFRFFLLKAAIDSILGCLLIFGLLWRQNDWLYALFGAFISALPDFPVFLHRFFPQNKLLVSYHNLHDLNHLVQKSNEKKLLPLINEIIISAIAILFLKL